MKSIVALAVLAGLASSTFGYTSKYDDLDVVAFVGNEEKLREMMDCFTDKKPCNKMNQDFKSTLPEVVRESCEKCNSIQKQKLKILLNGLHEKFPEEYNALKKQFDPTGKHFQALSAVLDKA